MKRLIFISSILISMTSFANDYKSFHSSTVTLSKIVEHGGPKDGPPRDNLYSYAPSLMYDRVSGKYKLWTCFSRAGDIISYQESTTLKGLKNKSLSDQELRADIETALSKRKNPSYGDKHNKNRVNRTKGDYNHVCDPNVFVHNGTYYLTYSGLNEYQRPMVKADLQAETNETTIAGILNDMNESWRKNSGRTGMTEILMAKSTDGGKTFQRVNNGNSVIYSGLRFQNRHANGVAYQNNKNNDVSLTTKPSYSYGVGQSTIVKSPVNNRFYMLYTNKINERESHLVLVSSYHPEFRNGTVFLERRFVAPKENAKGQKGIGGVSTDLAINPQNNRLVILANSTQKTGDKSFRMLELKYSKLFSTKGRNSFNPNTFYPFQESDITTLTFNNLQQRPGEGAGVLKDIDGKIKFHNNKLVIAAATRDQNCDDDIPSANTLGYPKGQCQAAGDMQLFIFAK